MAVVLTTHSIHNAHRCSPDLLGVREHVRLEVSGLSKPLVAVIKRTHVGSVSSVNTNMGTKVKVQRETFPTTLKSALYGRGRR